MMGQKKFWMVVSKSFRMVKMLLAYPAEFPLCKCLIYEIDIKSYHLQIHRNIVW